MHSFQELTPGPLPGGRDSGSIDLSYSMVICFLGFVFFACLFFVLSSPRCFQCAAMTKSHLFRSGIQPLGFLFVCLIVYSWLKTAEIYYLRVWKPEVQVEVLVPCSLKGSKGESFLATFSFWWL